MHPTDEELDEGEPAAEPSPYEPAVPDELAAEEIDDPGSSVQAMHTGLVTHHTDSPDDLDEDPARPDGMIRAID